MTFYESVMATVERPAVNREYGEFWRSQEPDFDNAHRVMRGGFFPHQRKWWQLPNFIKLLIGGYGAGKTNIGCKRIIASALTNAPCPVAMISPTFPIARQTTIKTTIELLAGKRSLLGRALWWHYNKSTHEFRIRYHGRNALIIVYSGDNPLSLRGPNLASAFIDEPFLMDEEVFEQMVARVRHPMAIQSEIFCTGTPEQLNWGYDLVEGELRDNHDVGFIQASSRANKALSELYIKRLEDMYDEKTASAYIEGNFENLAEGMVYHAFNRKDNVAEIEMPDNAQMGCGLDFNVNPMAASLFWTHKDHIHFFDEIELPNADTEFMMETLRDRYKDRLNDIYPDATGSHRATAAPGAKSDFWYIKNAGYTINAPPVNPKRRARYNATNGKLKSRTGKITMTFSSRCKKAIKYMSVYSYELMQKQKQLSHLLDAITYPVAYLFPVEKPEAGQYKLQGV